MPKLLSGNSITVNYTAPAAAYGNNYAQVDLMVTDHAGATSAGSTVVVNVLLGSAPTADQLGLITFREENVSTVFTLSGTDPDAADVNTLRFLIYALPTKCTIVQKGLNGAPDVDVTAVGTILASSEVRSRREMGSSLVLTQI